MKAALVVFCLLAVVLSFEAEKERFLAFQQDFGKSYDNVEEAQYRFLIFKQNMELIERKNAVSPNKVFGVTQFADMTVEEFKEMYLTYIRPVRDESEDRILVPETTQSPAKFDWITKGAVTPVKNQGQCGSCWAFSATENIESVWIIAGKATNTLKLSPQQIVDCDTQDGGCNGGDTPTAYQYVMSAGGLESNSAYPYTADDGDCAFDASQVVAKISNWKYATQNNDEKTMQNNLATIAPLSICVDAESWQFYNGGVMTADDCGTDLDHCVQVTGYDTTANPPYWIVRNSWGTSWGLSGYIYLSIGENTCGVAMEATTAVV